MKCPKCNGKCKTVQTMSETEAKIVQKAVEEKGVIGNEVKIKEVVEKYPITKRKCKCLNCGIYFFTKEKFDSFTETTLKSNFDIDIGKLEDAVYSIMPEKKRHVTIKIDLGGNTK